MLRSLTLSHSLFVEQEAVLLRFKQSKTTALQNILLIRTISFFTKMSEANKKKLLELVSKPENNICADCDQEGPEWASYTIGVFLCVNCAGIHRCLGSHISRVKSIRIDNWDRTQLASMEDVGNKNAKAFYEKYVPVYYKRPKHSDAHVLKEHWIRAKYEMKEFATPNDSGGGFGKAFMEGYLLKKGKKNGNFQKRKFVLTQDDGKFILKYFNKPSEKKPKAVISIIEVNATFCPNKLHPNGMQISYMKDGLTRSLFVQSEDAKTVVDWFMAIRAAKLHHLQVAFPTTSSRELAMYLTRDFIHEGFLVKRGPQVGHAYRRRYFVLDDRKLMYLDHPLDAYAKGEIFLGEKCDGYSVRMGIPCGLKQPDFGFMVLTPERTWYFGADTEDDRDLWIAALDSVMDKPVAPQDYASVNLREKMRRSNTSNSSRNSSHGSNHSSFSYPWKKMFNS